MDLMGILKALFGDEALTFEQFAEKVNNAADVKLGNLAGGQYVEKDKYDDVSKSSKLQTLILKVMTPIGRTRLSRHSLTATKSSMTTSLSRRLNLPSITQVRLTSCRSRLTLICQRYLRLRTAVSRDLTNSLQS